MLPGFWGLQLTAMTERERESFIVVSVVEYVGAIIGQRVGYVVGSLLKSGGPVG